VEGYDVVVAGGSISGLLTAREIGRKGYSVLVLEEGFEVGTPDHCGGLVSKSALLDLGIV
jgi:flavin-dependent dehydrogenase